MMTCCSKVICDGCYYLNCYYLNQKREVEAGWHPSCPFCRKSDPSTDEECDEQNMNRIEKNDPVAMCQEGGDQYVKGDYIKAFEYWTKAADLVNADAHYRLSEMYRLGVGVDKDSVKEIHHLEESAIMGHPTARYNLGSWEWNNGNTDRAVKHFIIAATQGFPQSTKVLMNAFTGGFVNKKDLAAALRAHQAAVDATMSSQRKAAENARAHLKLMRDVTNKG